MATPLTEDKNLKMPEAFGGNFGMERGRLQQAATNEAMRLGGGQITPETVARTIQTPFGVMSSSGEYKDGTSKRMTQADFNSSRVGMQIPSGTRTPEEQQALLAKMRETGAGIRQNIADTNLRGDRSGYYAFRQGLEERRAAEALTPSVYEGFTPGRDRRMAGAQAMVAAERWKQVAGGQRGAMETTPIQAFGGTFTQGGMGQFSPIQRPTYAIGGTPTSASFPSFSPTGSMSSTFGTTETGATGSISSGTLSPFFNQDQQMNSLYVARSPYIPFRS